MATVTIGGTNVTTVLTSLQLVDGMGVQPGHRGSDYWLPEAAAAVETTLPPGSGSCSVGGIIKAASHSALLTAIASWHSLAYASGAPFNLAYGSLTCRARYAGSSATFESECVARVSAQFETLSAWA